jgi:pimeloyl-ACP methyl ester carboxylesterase
MDKERRRISPAAPLIAMTGLLSAVGAGLAWIAYSRHHILHDIPMTAALTGALKSFDDVVGRVAYYEAGPAARGVPPMLFIHSANAAASSAEMRPLYEHYARHRRVYAIDLPGFGFSDRPDIAYSPRLYRDVLIHFISSVLSGGPVDAVALSLGCEFAALAAAARPRQFRSLVFLSPTGVTRSSPLLRSSDGLLRLLRPPMLGRPLFDLLVSRPAARFFLSKNQRRGLDPELTHQAYVTSHQPGAERAPAYFLAGKLFTPGIFSTYLALSQPALMLCGIGPVTRYDRAGELALRPNWQVSEFADCGELLHFDAPLRVVARMDAFYAASAAPG